MPIHRNIEIELEEFVSIIFKRHQVTKTGPFKENYIIKTKETLYVYVNNVQLNSI